MASPVGAIMIPLRHSEEAVRIQLNELPTDPSDIIDVLKAETAPLDVWLKVAVEYYKQGNVGAFKMILQEGSSDEIEKHYKSSRKERIAILNSLAAYYTSLASKEKEKRKREELFNLATHCFNRADKVDVNEQTTWVGKGILLLAKGDLERAKVQFDNVLTATHNSNVPALLGKAAVVFHQGKYEEALQLYRQALEINPAGAPASIRLGVGLCHYKLGRLELARKAFERVLQLDDRNVAALVALSILDLNSDRKELVQSAMQKLKRAYELDPHHPMVLNHLANHFFYKRDWNKVHTLAKNAIQNTEVAPIKAESFYQVGRAHHAQDDFDAAFQYYSQAVHRWPEHVLSQYGLGQVLLHRGEVDKAIACFERVQAQVGDNYEVSKVLASLYKGTRRSEKALPLFRKATDQQPLDPDAWIELAELLEPSDYAAAAAAYERAIEALEARGEKVHAALWNNLGVMRHMLADYARAEEAYTKAFAAAGAQLEELRANTITTAYNMARLAEATHNVLRAESLYRSLLKEHPNYVDGYLRLGCIMRERGLVMDAAEWFKEVLTISERHYAAWALIGNLQVSQNAWRAAQKKFEFLLSNPDYKDDPYALLQLGNIYYAARLENRALGKEKSERYLKLAQEFYLKVLKRDPKNIYAANGLAIVLAEKGYHKEAKDIFSQIRIAAPDFMDVWLNLAHLDLKMGLPLEACGLYENCLKKFQYNHDPTVLNLLAKAYFEARKWPEAKRALQRALHVAPHHTSLWYNLALTLKECAVRLLGKERPSKGDFRAALKDLEAALRLFKQLSAQDGKKHPFSTTKASSHAKYCELAMRDAGARLQKVERDEQELRERREREREQAEREATARQARDEEEAAKKAAEESRLEMEAREAEARLEALRKKWAEAQESEKKYDTKAGKRKRRAQEEQEEEEEEEAERFLPAPDDKEEAEKEHEEEPSEQSGRESEDGKQTGKARKRKREPSGRAGSSESWMEMRDRKNPKAKALLEKIRNKENEASEAPPQKRRRLSRRQTEAEGDAVPEEEEEPDKQGDIEGSQGADKAKKLEEGVEEASS